MSSLILVLHAADDHDEEEEELLGLLTYNMMIFKSCR